MSRFGMKDPNINLQNLFSYNLQNIKCHKLLKYKSYYKTYISQNAIDILQCIKNILKMIEISSVINIINDSHFLDFPFPKYDIIR